MQTVKGIVFVYFIFKFILSYGDTILISCNVASEWAKWRVAT